MAAKYGLVEPDLARVASPWHTDLDMGRPIEVMTDMALSRKHGFHRLSEHRRGVPRPVRGAARGKGHSLTIDAWEAVGGAANSPASIARQIAMDGGGKASDWTNEVLTPNRRRRSGGSAAAWSAQPLSDDRTRTLAHHCVSRTGPSAVPGTGSDRRRRRDLEHPAVPHQEPPDGNAGRHLHPRLCRQGAARYRDAAHPRADRAWRHRQEDRLAKAANGSCFGQAKRSSKALSSMRGR